MAFISALVDITLISIALGGVSQYIQHVFFDKKGMMEKQKAMRGHSSKMKELMKKEDEKSMRELKALEKEMMDGFSETMGKQTKMMVVMMVVYLPVLWYLPDAYSGAIQMPFAIPWLGQSWNLIFTSTTNWLGWYFLSALAFGILLNFVLSAAEKARGVKK